MTAFLMYHTNSLDTGRALAQALGIESGTHLPERRYDKVIRWGNRERIRYTPTKTLNKLEAMNNASNKTRALQYMKEHRIPCPPLVDRFAGKLLLARKSEHQHGSNALFITCQHEFDLARRLGYSSFMEYISIVREFRVHVLGGTPVFIYERVCPSDPKTLQIKNDWDEEKREIREVPRNIIDAAINSVRDFNLDFAAVDLGLSVNGNVFIFELNTAPGLVHNDGRHKPSFSVYKNYFEEWLNH